MTSGADARAARDRSVAELGEFISARLGAWDVGHPFAPTSAADIDPCVGGPAFYPRIFADVEAAQRSVHILMFGWKPGTPGDRLTELLIDRLEAGVEVRIIVDSFGSRPYGGSSEMFERLASAGAQIVVNDLVPPHRHGRYPEARRRWTMRRVGRADHRKLFVIDGLTAWTGGAGVEDPSRTASSTT